MKIGYERGEQVESAMKAVAPWIAQDRKVTIRYHRGTRVAADIFQKVIELPRFGTLDNESLMIYRAWLYHEAGHMRNTKLTKREYPKRKALHKIFNALEDIRMQRRVAEKFKGADMAFRYAMDFYNKDIGKKVTAGQIQKPLFEALCAMGFAVEGMNPAWKLTPEASMYFHLAYPIFAKVNVAKSAKDCVEIAKEIYELIKEEKKKQSQETSNQKGDTQSERQQSQNGDEGDDDEQQEGDGESYVDDDFDMEEEQEKNQDSQKKQKSESRKKDEQESEDEDNESSSESDNDDSDEDSKGSESDDDSDGSDETKDDDDADGDEDSGDSEDEESNGAGDEDSEEEDDEDVEDDSGDGESDSDESEEDENDEDGEEQRDGGSKTHGDREEDSENDSRNSKESKDGDDENDTDTQKDESDDDSEDSDGEDSGKTDEEIEDEMDDESDAAGIEEVLADEIEDAIENLDPIDREYCPCKDNDIFEIPDVSTINCEEYRKRREKVASSIMGMSRALEQALRTMARCRKNPYREHGRIDMKKLVDIAKSLDTRVFYNQRTGKKLDVACSIVIDESGSMGQWFNVQLLAIALGETLNAINVPFEIIGATTKYAGGSPYIPQLEDFTRTNPIRYFFYKTFDEPWMQVRPRITNSSSYNHHIDGEVVETAAIRLSHRHERRKVIFSLSDGLPCSGHFASIDDLMAKNLRRVCERARKSGVEVYGFGLGTREPKRYYGKDFFIYLKDMNEIGSCRFFKMFADVLTKGAVKF
jgi:hypothetical protein